MKANFKMNKKKDMGSISGQMAANTKDGGTRTSSMVWVFIEALMMN